ILFQGLRPSSFSSVLMAFASRQPWGLNGQNARAPTVQYWVFEKIRAKSNRGMGIWRQRHRDVHRLRPGEDDQGLTRQSCGRCWVLGYPMGSRFRGGWPLGGGWVESGVLKVLGAFSDKLKGSCRRPLT